MRHWGTLAVGAFAGLSAVPVAAESLTVEGIYGSRSPLPGEVEVIATESFGGDIGPDVVLDLSDALGRVYIEGEPFFRIVPAISRSPNVVIVNQSDDNSSITLSDPNAPDAVLRGSVRTNIRDRRVADKETRRCIARNDNGKCTERENVKYRCDELEVRLDPRITLVDPSGLQLYSRNSSVSQAVRYCEDERVDLRPDEMEDELRAQLVGEIVADLAPSQRREGIRIMESRKDLRRADRDAFRAAVRMTDDNPSAACEAFRALEAGNPSQVSLIFNIGLCAESEGDLDTASEYYLLALQIDPGRDYPTYAMDRIDSRRRGEAQLAARE
ncbi:MAG: hypothetical protein AAGE86_09705 [Pseudomonadota bacterium]